MLSSQNAQTNLEKKFLWKNIKGQLEAIDCICTFKCLEYFWLPLLFKNKVPLFTYIIKVNSYIYLRIWFQNKLVQAIFVWLS